MRLYLEAYAGYHSRVDTGDLNEARVAARAALSAALAEVIRLKAHERDPGERTDPSSIMEDYVIVVHTTSFDEQHESGVAAYEIVNSRISLPFHVQRGLLSTALDILTSQGFSFDGDEDE